MTEKVLNSPRKVVSFRNVALVFVALLAVGLLLGLVVYERHVAYEPVASAHVPPDATLAVRFDLTHVMLYEPFRRSLASLADRLPRGAGSPDRRARLEAQGLQIPADVREVLVVLGPARADWQVVVNGRLPSSSDGKLATVLREEGHAVGEDAGQYQAASLGFWFRQAGDGAVVLASSAERLQLGLAVRPRVAVLAEAAGGVFVREPWLPAPVQSLSGTFRAGSVLAVDSRLGFAAGTSDADRDSAVAGILVAWGEVDPTVGEALQRATRTITNDEASVGVRLPREAVQRLAIVAATWLAGPENR